MSGSSGGVNLRIGLQAQGAKEGLEQIGAAGDGALSRIVAAGNRTDASLQALQRSFARTQGVLDPLVAAGARYATQLDVIDRAEKAGLATAERADTLRSRAAERYDGIAAATQRATVAQEALTAATLRASQAQDAVNRFAGVSTGGDYKSRAADIAAYGAELDRLEAKYAPLTVAARAYEKELQDIAAAQRAGMLTSTQAASATAAAQTRLEATAKSAGAGLKNVGMYAGQAGFQLQDFVVQVGAGQSALVALAQQGSQFLGIFGTAGAIGGAVLAIGAITANLVLGKSAAQLLTEAMDNVEKSFQTTTTEAERVDAAMRRQNATLLSATQQGALYRQGLQGMGDDLVRLARYYDTLTASQRENARVSIEGQGRSLTIQGGPLQSQILAPMQGRIDVASGTTPQVPGSIDSTSLGIANVPQELQTVTSAAMAFRDAGKMTVEGLQNLISVVANARAGSVEYRSELEAYLKTLNDILPRVREFEEAERRVGVQRAAMDPNNGPQIATEGLRTAAGEVGGNYQTRQRIARQRDLLRQGLASDTSTREDRLAARSSLAALSQQEQGLTPATTQMLRGLEDQARLSVSAEGAARDLAAAELDLNRAARQAGQGMASATEIVRARMLVQERLERQLDQTVHNLDRQIEGENSIAQAWATSAQEGRNMEAIIRAQTDALKYGAYGSDAYATAVERLAVKYQALSQAQAERALSQRNDQTQNDIAYLQRENELIGSTVQFRERELAILRVRQQARTSGADENSEAVKAAERLAGQLSDTRQSGEQLRNSWTELSSFGERTFTKIGDALTEAFAQGKISAINFGSITKAVFSEVAQMALRLAVVNPILNSVFGGTRGTLGGVTQVASSSGGVNLGASLGALGGAQQAVASSAGSTTGALSQGGQSLSLASLGRYGNLGSAFSGTGLANTGWGLADGLLNTPLIGSGGLSASLGSQTFTGVYNGTATTAPIASGFGVDGLTVAGGIGAAAGIGLGGLSIYQGIQKGGVGGGVGVAGGVAGIAGGAATIAGGIGTAAAAAGSTGLLATMGPTLAALGPYGMIAAAVLAVVSALLPGEKASGKGQEFRVDLGSGATEKNGLGGSRYSGGNASQAEQAARGIASLAGQLSASLGGARVGGEVAVGVTSSRGEGPGTLYLDVAGKKGQFANTEEGAKELADKAAEYLLDAFRQSVSGDFAGILSASPTVEKLQENLTWYNEVYKSFDSGVTAANEYQQALTQVYQSFQTNIDKANELSLSTDNLTAAQAKALAQVTEQRDLQVWSFDQSMTVRDLVATGQDTGPAALEIALKQFDMTAKQQLLDSRKQLEGLGLGTEDVNTRILQNERVLANERLKIQRDFAAEAQEAERQAAEQAAAAAEAAARATAEAADRAAGSALSVVTNMRDYLRGLATSDASPGTVLDRFQAAGQDFNAVYGAARAGDANSISGLQGAAETYRALARQVYGGGQGYADAISMIGDRLGSISDLGAEALTQSFIRENSRENTDRIVEASTQLYSEIIAMRSDLRMILMRPAA